MFIVSHVSAQTATPTPLPITTPYAVGCYELETQTYPNIYLNINYAYNNNNDGSAISGLNVYTGHFIALRSQGIVFLRVGNGAGQTCTSGTSATIQICNASNCSSHVRPYTDKKEYIIPYVDDDSEIRVSYSDGQCTMIDSICVIPAGGISSSPTATPTPDYTATPSPHVYVDYDGTATRFDYVVSAGDVAFALVLIAIFVSIWVLAFTERD